MLNDTRYIGMVRHPGSDSVVCGRITELRFNEIARRTHGTWNKSGLVIARYDGGERVAGDSILREVRFRPVGISKRGLFVVGHATPSRSSRRPLESGARPAGSHVPRLQFRTLETGGTRIYT